MLKIKQVLIFINLIALFLIIPHKIQAQTETLCCPPGYSDSFWSCPLGTDRERFCCKYTFPANYETEEKIPCSEIYIDNPDRTVFPESTYYLDENRFASLNPLNIFNADPEFHDEGKLQPSGVINRALNFIFPLAGLILFVMIIWGGFEMLTGAAKKQNLDAGKQRVTAAITGFILLFISYWIVQIIEFITGVRILG